MTRFAVVLGLIVLAPWGALAHGSMTGWYGGQTADTPEGAHLELVARQGQVKLWVRDHAEKPLAATGTLTLTVAGKTAQAAFKPDGDALVAQVPVAPADGFRADVDLKVGGKEVFARFAQDALIQPRLDAKALEGQQAFQQACVTCHGAELRGTDKGPPLLHPAYGVSTGHGDEALLKVIRDGSKSHMWKFGDMPKPEGLKPGLEVPILGYIRAMQTANGIIAAPAAPAMDHSHHKHH